MKHALILLLLLTLCACSDRQEQPRDGIDLTGAWVLRHVEYPSGTEQDYALDGDGTTCLIYDQRNLLYECNIATTPTGLLVQPTATTTVTLVDKGGGEWLYLENGDPHPLRASDSTITIQRMGILYTFSRADSLYSEWGADIRDIFDRATDSPETENTRYMLSAKERQLTNYVYWLVVAVALIAIAATANYIVSRRRRRQMQLQLQQIRDVQQNRAPSVRQAAKSVEDTFFASDEYAALVRRMATGQLRLAAGGAQPRHRLSRLHHPVAEPLSHVRRGVPHLSARQAPHPHQGHCRRAGPRGQHHQLPAQATLAEPRSGTTSSSPSAPDTPCAPLRASCELLASQMRAKCEQKSMAAHRKNTNFATDFKPKRNIL